MSKLDAAVFGEALGTLCNQAINLARDNAALLEALKAYCDKYAGTAGDVEVKARAVIAKVEAR